MVQTGEMRIGPDPELVAMHNGVYMPMIETAEVVAQALRRSAANAQDEYALARQQRTAEAQRRAGSTTRSSPSPRRWR